MLSGGRTRCLGNAAPCANVLSSIPGSSRHTLSDLAKNNLSISHLILGLLGSAAHVVENIIYILLFLAFLLAGSGSKSGEAHGDAIDTVQAEAEEKIYHYIRGKVLISLIVAGNHACTLWAIGMRDGLWLVFAVLTVRKVDSNPRPFALLDPGSLCPSRPQSAEGRTCESISGRALELRASWIMAAC